MSTLFMTKEGRIYNGAKTSSSTNDGGKMTAICSIKGKEESENVGLGLNIQKTKIMASGHITSWQIDGETGNRDWLYFSGLQNHWRQ